MSTGYQVIARKWRSQTFDEIVGQEHVVRTLKNAITRNRIAHAYLFVGPRGTGKTSTARIFAKALNCENGPTPNPCGKCSACVSITNGSSMDVIEIDGASNNSVDQIRDLRDDVRYAAAGRYKVYIIDEVHMLSAAAFNALLKTLEEPPPHVKFVFATTEAHKVLPTIVSRCQRFDLKPIAADLISQHLAHIARAEKINVDPAALTAIARLADGGMRDAQSILDQMIAFCGDKITEADVLEVYGLASAGQVADLSAAIARGDYAQIMAAVDELDANGRDLVRLLTDLQTRVREALLDSVRTNGTSEILGVPMATEALTRLLDTLRESEPSLKFGLNEKSNLEVALLKAVENSRARAIDTLIRELSGLAGDAVAPGPSSAGEKKKVAPEPVTVRLPPADPAAEAESEAEPGAEAGDGDELPDHGGESYENAAPVERSPVGELPADPAGALTGRESPPSLERVIEKINPRTRNLLAELFKAEVTAVRKISREKLR